jgi:hypothetical protein
MRKEGVFAMFLKRQAILKSFAIAGLSIFTSMQIVDGKTIAKIPYNKILNVKARACEGEFKTNSDCMRGLWYSQIPLFGWEDACKNTCEYHGGFYHHIDCGTIASHAAEICGKARAFYTPAWPGVGGNRCGYNWWEIYCE